jgi:hypothetical protein
MNLLSCNVIIFNYYIYHKIFNFMHATLLSFPSPPPFALGLAQIIHIFLSFYYHMFVFGRMSSMWTWFFRWYMDMYSFVVDSHYHHELHFI